MQDHKYVRSEKNPGAVLNTDKNSLLAYKKKKKAFQEQQERIENLETQMHSLLTILQKIDKKLEEDR